MSDSKRRWFQIHSSTAVVLTLLSGALLWMNMQHGQNLAFGFPFDMGLYFPDTHQANTDYPALARNGDVLFLGGLKSVVSIRVCIINFTALSIILCLTALM